MAPGGMTSSYTYSQHHYTCDYGITAYCCNNSSMSSSLRAAEVSIGEFDVPDAVREMAILGLIRCSCVNDSRRKRLELERSREFAANIYKLHDKPSPVIVQVRFTECLRARPIQQPCWRSGRWKSRT